MKEKIEESSHYARDLLVRINNILVDGRPLYQHFLLDGRSLWSFCQYQLRLDIAVFTEVKDYKKWQDLHHRPTLSARISTAITFAVAFLYSLFSIVWLYLKPRHTALYSIDILDKTTGVHGRVKGVGTYLSKNSIPYFDVVHTLLGRRFLKNLASRHRPTIFLEPLKFIYGLSFQRFNDQARVEKIMRKISYEKFASFEIPFVKNAVRLSAERSYGSEFVVRLIGLIFHISKAKLFISIDDMRYANELLLAAKKTSVHSVFFQHSNFDYLSNLDTLPPELYAFPDTFFVWNKYWQSVLPDLSPLFQYHKQILKIGGNANGSKMKLFSSPPVVTDKQYFTVLVPYEVNGEKKVYANLIKEISKCPNTRIIFKARADYPLAVQMKEYGTSSGDEKVRTVVTITEKDLAETDISVGAYSTFLDDMIEKGKPVAVAEVGYQRFHDLSSFGLAARLSVDGSLCTSLKAAAAVSSEELARRREKLFEDPGDLEKIMTELTEQFTE